MTRFAPSSREALGDTGADAARRTDDQRDLSFELPGHAQPSGGYGLGLNVSISTAAKHQRAVDDLGVSAAGRPMRLIAGLIGREQKHTRIDAGQLPTPPFRLTPPITTAAKALEQHADAEIGGGAGSADCQEPAREPATAPPG